MSFESTVCISVLQRGSARNFGASLWVFSVFVNYCPNYIHQGWLLHILCSFLTFLLNGLSKSFPAFFLSLRYLMSELQFTRIPKKLEIWSFKCISNWNIHIYFQTKRIPVADQYRTNINGQQEKKGRNDRRSSKDCTVAVSSQVLARTVGWSLCA